MDTELEILAVKKRRFALALFAFMALVFIAIGISKMQDRSLENSSSGSTSGSSLTNAKMDNSDNPLIDRTDVDGTYYVNLAPEPSIRAGHASFQTLCPLMQKVIRWPLDNPTYYAEFMSVMGPINMSDAVSANGAYFSNPRVEERGCVVDIESSGIVNGNSYNWNKTCNVTEMAVSDSRTVAFKHFDPMSCR